MRLPERDESTAKFLRGMTIGALIGAVIAGSSLWSRQRPRRRLDATRLDGTVPPGEALVSDPARGDRT
jgi:hypothetical protein